MIGGEGVGKAIRVHDTITVSWR